MLQQVRENELVHTQLDTWRGPGSPDRGAVQARGPIKIVLLPVALWTGVRSDGNPIRNACSFLLIKAGSCLPQDLLIIPAVSVRRPFNLLQTDLRPIRFCLLFQNRG